MIKKDAISAAASKYPSDSIARENYVKSYLDSMGPVTVYLSNFTYQDCKEKELNLGLDLQGGMNVTLEVQTPGIIRNLSSNSTDAAFVAAMDSAESKYLGQQNFVDVFAAEYAKIAPQGRLSAIFFSRELESTLPNGFSSTNEEIYEYLKTETQSAIDRTFEIISTRIDKFGVTQPNIQRLENGRILVELPGVDDPSRVRKLLQTSAKLEFWYVYNFNEAYKQLEKANKIIYGIEQSKKGIDTANTADESTTPAFSGSTDEETVDAPEDSASQDSSSFSSLLTQKDSVTDDSLKTDEERIAENPLLSRFIPNVDRESNQWAPGGHLGYVPVQDTGLIKSYLAREEVKNAMPVDLQWKWGFKSYDETGEFYQLYGLKSSKDGNPALAGDVITDARPVLESSGNISVSMTMNLEGARDWKLITAKAAAAQPKESIAIVLDGLVYSAPVVNSEIPNGISSIEGNYTQREAEDLANILKAGKTPAVPRITGESTVGPSLGAQATKAGLTSLIIGFVLVIVFMIFYYGKAGIYADIALLANLILIVGVLAGLGAALTLPGMAGLVLTIGMAVDANVLVFERIREELKSGKSFKIAVKDGYKGAYSSIIDANITTLIAGIILWVLGKGPVMGFAVILVIGILSSLFTSIFLTRLFIEFDIAKGRETSFFSSMTKKMVREFNLNFIGKRKIFYIVSGLIIAFGIISLSTKGVSSGVDFQGGWSYVVNVDNASVTDIRTTLNDAIDGNNEVKTYGADNRFRITTSYLINSEELDVAETVDSTILAALTKFKVEKSDILSSMKVGPTIAKDVKVRSSWAIAFAVIGIFLYIILRFRKLGYGLGATVALFHDVLIVFSLYSIFWNILPFSLDIDQAFIAAILTVVGYSINDTVVVFDRVREYLILNKHESDQKSVINNAINQTLSRTLITSLTTLLVILILFIAGGEGLKGFTFALLVGVAVGTYSSVCIATPIVVDFFKKK